MKHTKKGIVFTKEGMRIQPDFTTQSTNHYTITAYRQISVTVEECFVSGCRYQVRTIQFPKGPIGNEGCLTAFRAAARALVLGRSVWFMKQ
jgi:hypothetical protein